MYLANDPLVNVYDLGSDTLRFAKERMTLASELLKDLDSKVVKDGESWARVRKRLRDPAQSVGQRGLPRLLLHRRAVGLGAITRGARGERDPVTPVKGAKQREALTFVADQILSDKAFKFSPALLRRLAAERLVPLGQRFHPLGGRVRLPDQSADSGHSEDRAEPVFRRWGPLPGSRTRRSCRIREASRSSWLRSSAS